MHIARDPRAAAIAGALTLAPLTTMNAIVGGRIERFFSLIRPGPHTSASEYVLLFAVLLLLPVGALIAARPLTERGPTGMRPIHALNGAVAVLLTIGFAAISLGLGTEIYRCDVLQIPNCD